MDNTNISVNPDHEQETKEYVYTVNKIRQMLGIGKDEANRLTHSKDFPAFRIDTESSFSGKCFTNSCTGVPKLNSFT